MDYLYYGFVVLFAIIIVIYFSKKNKTNESVYHTETAEDDNQDDMLEDELNDIDSEDNKETEQDSFSSYKFDIIFYWVTQKVEPNKNIDYDKLKEKILKIFGKLPEILEDNTTNLNTEAEAFLKEVLGKIECSSPIKYLLVTKSRRITALFKTLFSISGIVFIFLLQSVTNVYVFIYLMLAIVSFVLSSLCKKISEKIFNYMLLKLKPGDYLKIINSNDELIEKKVKINQLSRNETEFNKTTIYLSRNKLLCERYLELSSSFTNSINNKLCLYLILDYLKSKYSQEAYREYLLEKEIDTLEFISAFNPKSISSNYELSIRYFESERYEDFYETLLKCRNIDGYDWIIESQIISYEFLLHSCDKKN